MATKTLTPARPKNRILPSERQEMEDVIALAQRRLDAVRLFVELAEQADDFGVWCDLMGSAWKLAR